MTRSQKDPRKNQRLRTRKDLLVAAARLIKAGKTPSMDEIAEEALVSRATAYRYFPTLDSLLVEAPLEDAAPEPAELFRNDATRSPAERVDKAEAALHKMTYENERQLRLMLAYSLTRNPRDDGEASTPARQNRRTSLIEAALAPARSHFSDGTYGRLCSALALFFGPEAMVVFEDVLRINQREARKVKSWAIRALVQAALDESRATP